MKKLLLILTASIIFLTANAVEKFDTTFCVKINNPKQTLVNLYSYINNITPDKQKMYVAMTGAMLGAPSFDGIGASPAYFVSFTKNDDESYSVLALEADDTAMILNNPALPNTPDTRLRKGKYVFIKIMGAKNLQEIATLAEAEFSKNKSLDDVSVKFIYDANTIDSALANVKNAITNDFPKSIIDLYASALKDAENISCSMNIKPENLDFSFLFKAKDGTQVANLINKLSKRQPITESAFITENSLVQMEGSFNPDSYADILKFFEPVMKHFMKKGTSYEEFSKEISDYSKKFNGSFALNMDFDFNNLDPMENANFYSLAKTSANFSDLEAMYKLVDKYMDYSVINSSMDPSSPIDMAVSVETKKFEKAAELALPETIVQTVINTMKIKNEDGKVEEKKSVQESYAAISNGYAVQAYSPEALKNTIAKLSSNASAKTLDCDIQMVLSMQKIFEINLKNSGITLPEKKLKKINLEPLVFKIFLGNSAKELKTSFSASAIKSWIKSYTMLQEQAQLEAQPLDAGNNQNN